MQIQKRQLVWFFVLLLCSFPVQAQSPSSKPTIQAQSATKPVVSKKVLQIDSLGQIRLSGKPVAFEKFVLFLEEIKRQKPTPFLSLEIAPKAPFSRVAMVLRLFRMTGLKWEQKILKKKLPSLLAKKPAVEKAPKAPAPTAKQKTSQPVAKQKARRVVEKPVDWDKVPLRVQRGFSGKGGVEVRGQMRRPSAKKTGAIPSALIRYESGKRSPVGRLSTSDKGYFRYRLKLSSGVQFRVAVLSGGKFVEYPVPLERHKNGILFLRITLPKGNGKESSPMMEMIRARKAQLQAKRLKEAKANKKFVDQRKRFAEAKKMRWEELKLTKSKKINPLKACEYRLQVTMNDGRSPGTVVTGMMQKKGKKMLPIARNKTDVTGRIRYLAPCLPLTAKNPYEVILLFGSHLHKEALPIFKEGERLRVVQIKLPFGPVVWEGLHFLLEPFGKKWVKVTHFVTVHHQRTPDPRKGDGVWFPLPKGATKINLGDSLRGKKVEQSDRGLLLKGGLKEGTNRLAYAYQVPLKEGLLDFAISFSEDTKRVIAFIHPVFQLKGQKKKLKLMDLGKKGKPRKFQMLRLNSWKKGKELKLSLIDTLRAKPGFMSWLKRMSKNPNKRNKLIGISIASIISILSLFLLFSMKTKS